MPEAVTTKMEHQRSIPTLTIDTGDGVETLGLPAEEKWGFRLTGGSEFGMPVTVFQVSFSFFFNFCVNSFVVDEFSQTNNKEIRLIEFSHSRVISLPAGGGGDGGNGAIYNWEKERKEISYF